MSQTSSTARASIETATKKDEAHHFNGAPSQTAHHDLVRIGSTEANALPDTADEPRVIDLEMAAIDEKKPPPGPMDPASFPDGGFKAWLVVLGAFCCLFCSFGWINCIFPPSPLAYHPTTLLGGSSTNQHQKKPNRYRRLPRILPNDPPAGPLALDHFLDPLPRNLQHVRRGAHLRQNFRQLWSPTAPHPRLLLPRLRSHDGFPLNPVLPAHPCPGNLLTARRIRGLLSGYLIHSDMVFPAQGAGFWNRRLGVVVGRCDLSDSGPALDSQDWISMGYACGGVYDFGYVGDCQFDREVPVAA